MTTATKGSLLTSRGSSTVSRAANFPSTEDQETAGACFDFVVCLGAAPGLDKAPSGGEMPYVFTPPAGELTNSSSRTSSKPVSQLRLPPIDDDSVFDPMTDVDASAAVLGQGGSQVGPRSASKFSAIIC